MNLKDKQILIVDDESELREILADEFTFHGAVADTAENGAVGLEKISTKKYDCVVSDIRMPGGDGIALLKSVREKSLSAPPIVLVSGFSDLTIEDAYARGADGFIAKPFDLNNIVNTVSRLIISKALALQISESPTVQTKLQKKIKDNNSSELKIGRSGFFFAMNDHFPRNGAVIDFAFIVGTQKLDGFGIVRWSRLESKDSLLPGVGVEILGLQNDQISQYLNLFGNLLSTIPR